MKIPRIRHNAQINRAVRFTLKSSKKFVRHTRRQASELKSDGRKFLTGVMLISSSLNPQITAKAASAAFKSSINEADVFERSLPPGLIKDCMGFTKHTRTYINRAKHTVKPKLITKANSISLTENTTKSIEELNVLFNNLLLKSKRGPNPLINKASVFVSKGEKYGINPVVLMGIAMTESARGTSNAAIVKKNVGGIMGKRNLKTFSNIDDCIDKMAETVAKHHKNSHVNTLSELGYSGKYCDKSVAGEWIKNVMYYIKKLS